MLKANLFYTSFYRTGTSCLANSVFRRGYSRGSCRGHARSCFQSALLHWRLLYTSALASRQLPCCLQTSAACLLCQTWLCSALFDAMPSYLSFTPCLLPWAVRHACVSDPSTQSPDALFSIVLKPPTGDFSKHRLGVLLFHFRIRGFKTTASGFSNHRPVVHNTDRGFSNTDLFFSRGFTTSAPIFVPSVGVSVGIFLLPAAFCLRTPTGFFTRLLFLFLHIVRELLLFISL